LSSVGGILSQVTAATVLVPDSAAQRKARGAFFTPRPLARFVTDWAVRGVTDRVLEPSCGEAAFLLAAVERLSTLGAGSVGSTRLHLDGVELHAESAKSAE
jgi:type I restriction-modification system DNA methylase subunit